MSGLGFGKKLRYKYMLGLGLSQYIYTHIYINEISNFDSKFIFYCERENNRECAIFVLNNHVLLYMYM